LGDEHNLIRPPTRRDDGVCLVRQGCPGPVGQVERRHPMSGVGEHGRDPKPIASGAACAGNEHIRARHFAIFSWRQVHRLEKRGFG